MGRRQFIINDMVFEVYYWNNIHECYRRKMLIKNFNASLYTRVFDENYQFFNN